MHPVVSVYKTKGQQLHYSGNIINFPQDVKSFSRQLPQFAAVYSILVVRKSGQAEEYVDFRVSRTRVLNALVWLKNNEFYREIEIDYSAISELPENGTLLEKLPTTTCETKLTMKKAFIQHICQLSSHNFSNTKYKKP